MSEVIIKKLFLAQVASCSCLTKTHIPQAHEEDCLYRVLCEAIEAIKEARNQALEEAAVICDQLASGFAIEGMAMQRIGALDCSFTIRDRKIN